MIHELSFSKNDRIAVIAPHPDDECLGASAPLLLVPDQTDVMETGKDRLRRKRRSAKNSLRQRWNG